MPAAERAQAVARFRDGRNSSYQAALAELVVHEALLRQGFEPETQPPGGHPTRRLDFLVRGDNNTVAAYVEVTSINPTPDWVARSNREAQIYNAIDGVALPAGWRLGYAVGQHGQHNPNLNDLRDRIRTWAEEAVGAGPESMPQRIFEAADYRIELTCSAVSTPLPKSRARS